eukprot:COSAG02_NODE_3524_length_6615_cov_6.371393_7_plen_37_part_00
MPQQARERNRCGLNLNQKVLWPFYSSTEVEPMAHHL